MNNHIFKQSLIPGWESMSHNSKNHFIIDKMSYIIKNKLNLKEIGSFSISVKLILIMEYEYKLFSLSNYSLEIPTYIVYMFLYFNTITTFAFTNNTS